MGSLQDRRVLVTSPPNGLSIVARQPSARSMPTSVAPAGLTMTKALSKESAAHGICVNAVCGAAGYTSAVAIDADGVQAAVH